MLNAHYPSIEHYRDVESLNYYRILLEQGKSEKEALETLAARSRDNSRTPMQWNGEKILAFDTGTVRGNLRPDRETAGLMGIMGKNGQAVQGKIIYNELVIRLTSRKYKKGKTELESQPG